MNIINTISFLGVGVVQVDAAVMRLFLCYDPRGNTNGAPHTLAL
jgi:hypothetical protein